jgi:hypothetical protein
MVLTLSRRDNATHESYAPCRRRASFRRMRSGVAAHLRETRIREFASKNRLASRFVVLGSTLGSSSDPTHSRTVRHVPVRGAERRGTSTQ